MVFQHRMFRVILAERPLLPGRGNGNKHEVLKGNDPLSNKLGQLGDAV